MSDLGGQSLAIPEADPLSMSAHIDLALKVSSLLQENWQRAWLREAIPFLAAARWGAALLDLHLDEPQTDELEHLVDSVMESIDAIGISRPERVAAFILADWDQLPAHALERVLLRLSDRFPEAKVEAMPLHDANSTNLELVIAAGAS